MELAIVILLSLCLAVGIGILFLVVVGILGTAKGTAAFHSALATTILRMNEEEQDNFLESLQFWMATTLPNLSTNRTLDRARLYYEEIFKQVMERRTFRDHS